MSYFYKKGQLTALNNLNLRNLGTGGAWGAQTPNFGPTPPGLKQHMQQFNRFSRGTGLTNPQHPFNRLNAQLKHSSVRVSTPYEQTFQQQASSLMGVAPTTEELSAHWDEHDKRMEEKTLHSSEDSRPQI